MTAGSAKRWVIGALALSAVLAAFADLKGGRKLPRVRILFGAMIAAAMLSVLAEAEPQLATAFAAIILTGAVLSRGAVITQVTDFVSGKA
jgi:hypothetical protein